MVLYDYGDGPLVEEVGTLADYIVAMVRKVTFGWEGDLAEFKFRMHPRLWERVAELYACFTEEGESPGVPLALIEGIQVHLKESQRLPVDGVEYPVVLDEECEPTSIYFGIFEEEGEIERIGDG